LSSN